MIAITITITDDSYNDNCDDNWKITVMIAITISMMITITITDDSYNNSWDDNYNDKYDDNYNDNCW